MKKKRIIFGSIFILGLILILASIPKEENVKNLENLKSVSSESRETTTIQSNDTKGSEVKLVSNNLDNYIDISKSNNNVKYYFKNNNIEYNSIDNSVTITNSNYDTAYIEYIFTGLDKDKVYDVSADVSTTDVTIQGNAYSGGVGASIYLQNRFDYQWEGVANYAYSERVEGTNNKNIKVTAIPNKLDNTIYIRIGLGNLNSGLGSANGAKGKVVIKNLKIEEYQGNVIEKENVRFIYDKDMNIDSAKAQNSLDTMQTSYELLYDLVGIQPFDGDKVNFVFNNYHYAGAFAGYAIQVGRAHAKSWIDIEVLPWGMVHELAHTFEYVKIDNKNIGKKWNFHGECLASFKPIYVAYKTGMKIDAGKVYTYEELIDEWKTNTNYTGEKMLYKLWQIVNTMGNGNDSIGWEKMKLVFRKFQDDKFAENTSNINKFFNWVDIASEVSGIKINHECFTEDEWKIIYNNFKNSGNAEYVAITKINNSSIELNLGERKKVKYEPTTATARFVSDDSNTVKIDYDGTIIPIGTGTDTINVTSYFNKDVVGTYTIKTNKKIISKVNIKEYPKTDYNVNENIDLSTGKLELIYEDGSSNIVSMTDSLVKVSSYDNTNTTEYQKITLTIDDKTVEFDIRFWAKGIENNVSLQSISLNKQNITLKKGETETIKVTMIPNNATTQDIIWISSDTKVATVKNGVITAVGEGEATITVTITDKGQNVKRAKVKVTVKAETSDNEKNSGLQEDNTIAPNKIPQAGINYIVLGINMIILLNAVIILVCYKKIKLN